MNQVHGKTFSLQHITCKIPGQFMPIAKATNFSPSTSLPPDLNITVAASQSDCSESTSPSTIFPEKVNANGESLDTSITVTPSSPDNRGSRQPKSPISDGDSTDTLDDLTKSDKYPFSHRTISHLRNSSMDEITLQLLKTQGATFYIPNHQEEQPRERASTLTRLNAKKPRKIMTSMLSPISHSEEDLSEPQRTGSAENLKTNVVKRGKKGDKDRNSLVLVERTSSDSIPNREESRKDKKGNQNKHRRQRSQGLVKTLDVDGCKDKLMIILWCVVLLWAVNLRLFNLFKALEFIQVMIATRT